MVNFRNAAYQKLKRAAKKYSANPTQQNAEAVKRAADYAREKGWKGKKGSRVSEVVEVARSAVKTSADVQTGIYKKLGIRGDKEYQQMLKDAKVIDPDILRKGLKGMAKKFKCGQKTMEAIERLNGFEITQAYKNNNLLFEQIFDYETYYNTHDGKAKARPCDIFKQKLSELFGVRW